MPTREISYAKATGSLVGPPPTKSLDNYSTIITTSLGSTLLEIQGELNLPEIKPEGLTEDEEKLFIKTSLPAIMTTSPQETVIEDAVKLGRLELAPDFQNATLFISNSQRLVGKIEKISPPLGVLEISKNEEDGSEVCEIIDVIEQKIVFRFRPLPIM